MKKILVTDLFGTLVPDNFEQAHNLYGNGKKPNLLEITGDKDYLRYLVEKISEQSMNDLNKFLDEGNIAFIVCNLTAHDITIDIILDKLIKRFHNYSDNNFYLFFVANDNAGYFDIKRLSNEATDKYVENGVNYFVYNNDKIVIIKKKEDVFDIIKNKYNLQDYKLFSIGNKQDDIPMLIKSVELGGRGSLLNYELYTDEELNKKMIDQAIVFKIRIEHLLLTEQELLSHNPNFSKMSQEEQCKLKQKYLYCGGLLKWFNSINEYKKKDYLKYIEI